MTFCELTLPAHQCRVKRLQESERYHSNELSSEPQSVLKTSMRLDLLVYSLTIEGSGVALFPFLEQSAVQASSLFGWYVSLLVLFSLMIGGVALTAAGLITRGRVALGKAKVLVAISSTLAIVFTVGVLWSEAIYSDTLAACPGGPGTQVLTRCDTSLGQSFLPFVYGIGLASCVLVLAGSARTALSLVSDSRKSGFADKL
jgi:hypothetical protein